MVAAPRQAGMSSDRLITRSTFMFRSSRIVSISQISTDFIARRAIQRFLAIKPTQFDSIRFDSRNDRCWIFNHLSRAGGSTIKYMLKPWVALRHKATLGVYDDKEWFKGGEFARRFLDEKNTITWGAYAEALRPHGAGDECKWFTIFRQYVFPSGFAVAVATTTCQYLTAEES